MTEGYVYGIDHFLFPKATIRKIIKPMLLDKRIQPTALELMNESAVMFLSQLTIMASSKTKIKTLRQDTIKTSIEELGFKMWLKDIDDMVDERIMEEAQKKQFKETVDHDNDQDDQDQDQDDQDTELTINDTKIQDMEDLQ